MKRKKPLRGAAGAGGPGVSRGKPLRVATLLETSYCWHRAILHGIADYMQAHARWEVYIPSLGDITTDARTLAALGIQGLIVGDSSERSAATWRTLLRASKSLRIPTVLALSTARNSGLWEVVPDDLAVGRLAAKHLQQQGFRNFGYYGGDLPFSRARMRGFTETLAAFGQQCKVCLRDEIPWGKLFHEWETKPLEKWILKLTRPAAIMACSDLWARHIAYTCRRVGLRIPEDIALVGVDNDPALCEIIAPPLTSVPLDPRRIGFVAAGLLGDVLQGKTPLAQPVTVPPLALVPRHSTDLLVVDDADIAVGVRFIRENAAATISVEDILDKVRISRRKLEMGFQRNFGRTPQKEIWRVHVDRAKALLEQTSMKMERVAQQSGFSGVDRMSVIFRRETGVTPRAWRENARGR